MQLLRRGMHKPESATDGAVLEAAVLYLCLESRNERHRAQLRFAARGAGRPTASRTGARKKGVGVGAPADGRPQGSRASGTHDPSHPGRRIIMQVPGVRVSGIVQLGKSEGEERNKKLNRLPGAPLLDRQPHRWRWDLLRPQKGGRGPPITLMPTSHEGLSQYIGIRNIHVMSVIHAHPLR